MDFYQKNTIKLAQELLGKMLINETSEGIAGGVIVETEAYAGKDDPASHAANGPTQRSKIMFGKPGISYVYFSYGMHNLFNVVAEKEGIPGAVLVRALEPVIGIELMKLRRKTADVKNLCSGPGKLTEALNITLAQNNLPLFSKPLYIIDGGLTGFKIESSPRIGISKATKRPWRFYIKDCPYVSVKRAERKNDETKRDLQPCG